MTIASTPSMYGVPHVPSLYEAPSTVLGITDAELDIIRGLFLVWEQKYERNVLRSMYFDGKMALKPTGNIPAESMTKIKAVLGWPEKAVSVLAELSVFDDFVSENGESDPFGISEILEDNRFDLELPQAISAAYKHSSSFITTALGDTQAGEPEVLVLARSAEWSSAIWDQRRRALSSFLAVTSTDNYTGQPLTMDVYLPDVVLSMTRRPSGSWTVDRRDNKLGEVLVEPMSFDPQLGRPFGRSRISRAVMNITDRALMSIVRTEISADFYAAPRMYALGVAETAFNKGKWNAAIDRWFALTKNADDTLPVVGQFPQMTMQPLVDHYKLIATQFSGETGVPVANLGIITENPASAEAQYAADRRLVSVANRQNRIFGSALKRIAQRTIRLRDGVELSSELRGISSSWVNPAFTSPATSADALLKLSKVFPWLGESEVALEFAGFSRAEIKRLLADKNRANNRTLLTSLSGLATKAPVVPGVPDAQGMPAQPNAQEMPVAAAKPMAPMMPSGA